MLWHLQKRIKIFLQNYNFNEYISKGCYYVETILTIRWFHMHHRKQKIKFTHVHHLYTVKSLRLCIPNMTKKKGFSIGGMNGVELGMDSSTSTLKNSEGHHVYATLYSTIRMWPLYPITSNHASLHSSWSTLQPHFVYQNQKNSQLHEKLRKCTITYIWS